MTYNLTPDSLALFLNLANDADNWGGQPCWDGNVGGGREANGNLTDLKRRGLVTTDLDEGCVWVTFTAAGRELAASHGITL
jgi:hypothetical protein